MNTFFLMLLLISTGLAKTEVSFVDSCSQQEIKVSNPNGTQLLIELNNLAPQDDLELSVIFRPAGIVEDLSPRDQITHQYYFKARKNISAQGKFSTLLKLPKEKWMWQVEQRHAEYRIWDAEVKWVQARSRKAGSDVASFYRAPDEGPYFQLLSAGLCQWEGSAHAVSKLYENNSTTWMNVTRESQQSWEQGNGPGIALGYNNNNGSSIPLSPLRQANSVMGWLFKDWQKQLSQQQTFLYEKKFVLNKEEAGLFISRLTFNRHEVKRFEWKESAGSCGQFVEVSRGLLDVGQVSEDFVVLPKNFYPRPERLKDFINTVRPTINNCGSNELNGPQNATDILPSGADGILYYYQQTHKRGIL